MVRMMQKDDNQFKEVALEKDGHWRPWAVFCVNPMNEVLIVESKLENEFEW